MISMLTAPIVALASLAPAGESWETLSREFEQAFEAWVAGERGLAPGAERVEWDTAPFQPRFLALAEEGEGRAVLWLIANLEPENAPRVLELVERGGEAEWVGSALHVIGRSHASFDAARLAELLEKRMASAKDPVVRARAVLARASMLEASDAELAAELRIWGAMLQCQGVDLAPGERLASEDLEELAPKVLAVLDAASGEHFELAYYPFEGTYYPRAGAPPDPEEIWRPVLDVLAQRGIRRAQFWSLSNAPWQLDEAGKARLTSHLDAVSSAPLESDELQMFGYRIGSLVYRLGIDAVEPRVRRLLELSPEQDRAGLLFGLGDALCDGADADEARRERGLACLREVTERWPASEQASSAKGRLFRYTKLLVGMPCPDFESVDADGTPFKLSDYRGKVTVVDFWGFW